MHGQDENFITHFGPCFQPRSPGVTKRNNAVSRLTAICKLSLDNAIILDTAQPDKRINRGSRWTGRAGKFVVSTLLIYISLEAFPNYS